MDAIEKAKVTEFRERLVAQAKQNQMQIVDLTQTNLRVQGGIAVCDYVLAIDPIVVDEEDEVTADDLRDLETYINDNPLEVAVEGAA